MDHDEARARLLDAAEALYYRRGIHAVGMDEVRDRAGVSLARLYRLYPSKPHLVAAYLRARDERWRARLAAFVEAHAPARAGSSARLLAVFDWLAEWFAEPDYRGCAFSNATAENHGASAAAVTAAYREWVRETFAQLAREAGARDPDALAGQLRLIWDGVSQSVRFEHDPAAVHAARRAAAALVDAAIPRD